MIGGRRFNALRSLRATKRYESCRAEKEAAEKERAPGVSSGKGGSRDRVETALPSRRDSYLAPSEVSKPPTSMPGAKERNLPRLSRRETSYVLGENQTTNARKRQESSSLKRGALKWGYKGNQGRSRDRKGPKSREVEQPERDNRALRNCGKEGFL